MANISLGTFTTSVADASAGTVVWTDAGNAAGNVSDANAYATATFASDGAESQYLVFSGAEWQRNVPDGATIVGFRVFVEGEDTRTAYTGSEDPQEVPNAVNIFCNEARVVVGGVIQASSDLAPEAHRYLGEKSIDTGGGVGGGIGEEHEIYIGKKVLDFGITLTPAQTRASDFGVALRFKSDSAVSTLAKVDAVRVAIYWTGTVAATLISTDNDSQSTATGMAPYVFACRADESIWGDQKPEDVEFRYEVLTHPAGWSQQIADPRLFGTATSTTWDKKTCARGYAAGFDFDAPGVYTVRMTMHTNNQSTYIPVTTTSNTITVTVNSNTRTPYTVGSSGRDFPTVALACASHGSTDDVEIQMESGHDEDITTLIILNSSNFRLTKMSGAAVEPTLRSDTGSGSGEVTSMFQAFHDDGIRFDNFNVDRATSGGKCLLFVGNNCDDVAFVDIRGNNVLTLAIAQGLASASETNERWFMQRVNVPEFDRYLIYFEGEIGRDLLMYGCSATDDGTNEAEGHFRFSSNPGSAAYGTRCVTQLCLFAGTTTKGTRPGSSFYSAYWNQHSGSAQMGFDTQGASNRNNTGAVRRIVGCVGGNSSGGFGWGGKHIAFVNCYLKNFQLQNVNGGIYDVVKLKHCTMTTPGGGSVYAMGTGIAWHVGEVMDFEFMGCNFAPVSAGNWSPGNNWYFRQINGRPGPVQIRHCTFSAAADTDDHWRFNNDQAGVFGDTFASYNFTELSALSNVTGIIRTGLDEGDFDAALAADYWVDSATPGDYTTVPSDETRVGVFDDIRGTVDRDSSASFWRIGPRGAEAENNPPNVGDTLIGFLDESGDVVFALT